ncbi:MAG TPA: hypothetical protein PLR69_11880, partial [Candidatus Limiplasma sp.]|nr:hypothetical protein [Candidatus Limiplasma sp.]
MDGNANRGNARPRYFHRELTWLRFNQRVQAEADHPENPLLERAKFLAIVTSNLDEFMQVRYHRLLENAISPAAGQRQPCGLSHAEILRQVNRAILRQQNQQYLLYEGIHSELHHLGIQFYPTFAPNEAMAARIKQIFLRELVNRLRPVPWGEEIAPVSQKKLHLFIRLQPRDGREARFATLSLPSSPRLYLLPSDDGIVRLIRQEEIVKLFLPSLFPEDRVEEASVFRILRNQDFPLDDRGDVATEVRDMLMKRRTGDVMRLEAEERMSAGLLEMLTERFRLSPECRYRVTGPLDLNKLMMNLYNLLDRPDLKYHRADPLAISPLCGKDIFAQIEEKDWLLYHPYHSFEPVVNLLNQAAEDPDVCSVKTTLYRVG